MFTKICKRPVCSKEFNTPYKSKEYCSALCRDNFQAVKCGDRYLKKILDHFGNKCSKCGFPDSRALQIDHVSGDGIKQIRNSNGNNRTSRTHYYRVVLREIDSGKYQILCANCNWIKRHTNSEK
jgi:hypothetical protein